MKGILVSKDRNSYPSMRFSEEAKALGIELYHWDDFLLNSTMRFDFAIFRNLRHEFQKVCPKVNRQFNDYAISSIYKSQANQILNIEIGLPKPLTLMATSEANYETVSRILGHTFVAKSAFTTLSTGTFLIHNEQEFDKVRSRVDIFQEFIESSRGTDIRIVLLGGEPIVVTKRTNESNWRSSLNKACTYEFYDLPEEVMSKVRRVSKYHRLDLCAVDLLIGRAPDEYYFLEVNMTPSLVEMESITGENLTKDYLQYVKEQCNMITKK